MIKIFVTTTMFLMAVFFVSCGHSHDHDPDECGGHGHLHGNKCHCDNGYKLDPDDSTNCIKDEEERAWECEDGKDGWERCTDNKIQYCHIVEGMEPHFHWGQDCQKDGYECVEVKDGEAVCVDKSLSCSAGEFSCDTEKNIAYNCVDGHKSVNPCGTSKKCHETATEAVCEEKDDDHDHDDDAECGGHGHLHGDHCHCDNGYEVDPEDPENCIPIPFPQLACNQFEDGDVKTIDGQDDFADFPKSHADLDIPVKINLVQNSDNYIHFPVTKAGDYVVFLDKADLFEAAYNKDGDELSVGGNKPNGMCPETLKDHWHITADYEVPEGGKLPAVIKFKASEETEVNIIIKFKG